MSEWCKDEQEIAKRLLLPGKCSYCHNLMYSKSTKKVDRFELHFLYHCSKLNWSMDIDNSVDPRKDFRLDVSCENYTGR